MSVDLSQGEDPKEMEHRGKLAADRMTAALWVGLVLSIAATLALVLTKIG